MTPTVAVPPPRPTATVASAAYFTPQELLSRWKRCISNRTLVRWRIKGHGPAYVRIGDGRGSRILYRVTDVVAWENNNRFIKPGVPVQTASSPSRT